MCTLHCALCKTGNSGNKVSYLVRSEIICFFIGGFTWYLHTSTFENLNLFEHEIVDWLCTFLCSVVVFHRKKYLNAWDIIQNKLSLKVFGSFAWKKCHGPKIFTWNFRPSKWIFKEKEFLSIRIREKNMKTPPDVLIENTPFKIQYLINYPALCG